MRPGYPSQPGRDYTPAYDNQQRGGKKLPKQQAWGQNYGPEAEDFSHQAYDPQGSREAERYQPRGAGQPRHEDNYYYQNEPEQQHWAPSEYQAELGHYHPGSRQYQPSIQQSSYGQYNKGGKGAGHTASGPGNKQNKQSPPRKRDIPQSQSKRLPQGGRESQEKGFGSQYSESDKYAPHADSYSEEREQVTQQAQRQHQERRFPQNVPKSLTLEEGPAESSRKQGLPKRSQPASFQGGASRAAAPQQARTKHAFGEYYTQQQYIEMQERRKKLALQEVQPAPTESGGTLPTTNTPASGRVGQPSAPVQSAQDEDRRSNGSPSIGLKMSPAVPIEQQDPRFARAMAKFNTLDRGTYFVDEQNKQTHFLVAGRDDLLGWSDTFVINGYFLNGVIIKLTTLTSRIFLFIENLHPIFKKYIRVKEEDQTAQWSDEVPDKQFIGTLTSIEKVEVFDNDEEGFQGFVCYTICEDSKIVFETLPDDVDDWRYVQELILLYEPTSIRKIYLDMVYNSIYKPESKGFGGRRIAAIVNPDVPAQTIQYSKKPQAVLDKTCIVGTIWIQNGRYTLIAETVEHMERLVKMVDLALDIAEELGAYVMITNLRRTFDLVGKTILYINSDPTLKLIRSNNPISFATKVKRSENLV